MDALRAHLKARARWLSYFTVAYNVLEGLASLVAGAVAGSIALVGFGLDSFVESLSGGVMIWRFQHREGLSHQEEERLEQRALKLVGYAFFVLAAYIAFESVRKLYLASPPEPSLAGMVITGLSLIVMPLLFYAKRRTGQRLKSESLVTDAKQTMACVVLSAAVLLGLVLNATTGFWQIDPLIGLLIAAFLAREGREAIQKGKLCSC